ncbi:MAG TPA: DEAD/DEAH box helicase [Bacteroidales bacterium]|nr:DEAD/DEAH box helicase [Bacteroidales bacterium]
MNDILHQLAPGVRISVRGEDFLVNRKEPNHDHSFIISCQGLSELVKGKYFKFDTAIDSQITVLEPDNTILEADTENGYQKTKLFIETILRNASFTSKKIEISHKAAINGANFQFTPTLMALNLPRPRILIADAVGLGKTVEAGIFMSELIKRGQGQRILVIALKSILAQFQQELWNRFAIPLVRLDSEGIAKIKAELPANKNPFDYYDKTIISIDTLKNNAKFKHYLEKSRWDIIAIDEVHTVANVDSLRGSLAQFLATRCQAMVLTSATPHNGKKESFANIITMLEPTAIPRNGDYSKADVGPYYVRRFKNDIMEASIKDKFQDREIITLNPKLSEDEIAFLKFQQNLKLDSFQRKENKKRKKDLLFSIGLFKSFMSSPRACLKSVNNRIEKVIASPAEDDLKENNLLILEQAKALVEEVINSKQDSKYIKLKEHLVERGWKGRKSDDRIIIFTERIETMTYLAESLSNDFDIEKGAKIEDMKVIQLFDGTMSDMEQQFAVEDFGKEDSDVRVFITSDAGAQGVNLHYYCNHLYNYDVPWSIITLEQRNGRIDRFGQAKTPYIYYLLADADVPGLKTDLHIVKRLVEKENEAYKTLGDAGSVMHLYDARKEELKVEKAMMSGVEDDQFLTKTDEEFSYLSLFDEEDDKTPGVIDDKPIEPIESFYNSDYDFYKTLIQFLISNNALRSSDVSFGADGLIEFLNSEDLDQVLYALPPESKPKRNGLYKLTIDKKKVDEAIAKARKKKGEWAEFQVMYDLHPIIQYMMTKLEALIDKDKAMVLKTNKLPSKNRFYVFHGQVSNDLGNSVLSDFFVVGLDEAGALLKTDNRFMSLMDFIKQYSLNDMIYNEEMSNSEIFSLQENVKDAVEYAKNIYMKNMQDNLTKDMTRKKNEYQEKLSLWERASRDQLQIEFENQSTVMLRSKKEKAAREIETILNERSQYVKDLTSLGNEAYLKLIGVLYNS